MKNCEAHYIGIRPNMCYELPNGFSSRDSIWLSIHQAWCRVRSDDPPTSLNRAQLETTK
jgi:hypothetical protein